MANSATVSRTQLLYGLCLPLAALIGFFLADPLQSSSLAVLAMIGTILCWPLFVRWYHPALVLSFHSVFYLSFLPGAMPLWAFIALGGFMIALFHRSVNREVRLLPDGGVPWALLLLGAVVAVTAVARGGVGLKVLGSEAMGGKRYVFIILAIMAYFALVSRPVPRKWVFVYAAIYCLSGLTNLLSHLVYLAGSQFYWLFGFIDSNPAAAQASLEWDVTGQSLFRSTSTMVAASAAISFLLIRFGLKDLLNLKKPWRVLLLLACLVGGLLGGFRSFLLAIGLVMVVLFWLEGLHRTRYLAFAVAVGLLGFAALTLVSDRLPASIQRAISFLPVRIDDYVRRDAEGSLEWRLQMWDLLVRDVPSYLALGKGYAVDPGLLHFSTFNERLGYGIQAEWAVLTGEYHNGPLSVLIPFGLVGALAFCWLLVAGARRLMRFCRHGDPTLLNINRALCAFFIAKSVFFVLFFGSLYSDLVEFTAVLGLAECLNAGSQSEAVKEAEISQDAEGLGALEQA